MIIFMFKILDSCRYSWILPTFIMLELIKL